LMLGEQVETCRRANAHRQSGKQHGRDNGVATGEREEALHRG
jgi:hypothetical protein